jgi:hypothetical protein
MLSVIHFLGRIQIHFTCNPTEQTPTSETSRASQFLSTFCETRSSLNIITTALHQTWFGISSIQAIFSKYYSFKNNFNNINPSKL